MKIKLKSTSELAAVAHVFRQLFDKSVVKARQSYDDGILTSSDLYHRIVALHMLENANDATARTVMQRKQAYLKLTPQQGLAVLAAWYNTDTTELEMDALAEALMASVTNELERALTGPRVLL